jgi:ribosomal protein L33
MGKTEPKRNSQIIQLTCSACRVNIVYLKVDNHENNNAPFEHSQFTCTECNQGLMQNHTNPQ